MTAVEFLKQNLPSLFQDDSGHYAALFEQAKEMEKQQMRTAYTRGYNDKEKGFFNAAKLITKNQKQ